MSRLSLGGGQEVFITVRVAESDYFRREGQDVHTTAYISLSQALLGGVIRITGLDGDLNLRIPQVRQSSITATERQLHKLVILVRCREPVVTRK